MSGLGELWIPTVLAGRRSSGWAIINQPAQLLPRFGFWEHVPAEYQSKWPACPQTSAERAKSQCWCLQGSTEEDHRDRNDSILFADIVAIARPNKHQDLVGVSNTPISPAKSALGVRCGAILSTVSELCLLIRLYPLWIVFEHCRVKKT